MSHWRRRNKNPHGGRAVVIDLKGYINRDDMSPGRLKALAVWVERKDDNHEFTESNSRRESCTQTR